MPSLTAFKTPDIKISVKQTFGIDTEMEIDAFSKKNEFVPKIDQDYKFDRDTTLAILSGFAFNKRVLIQGYHGTGKSTHIEQVAARLNWPCVRVNLDGHISRIDLIGKDAIVLRDGKQVTEFKEFKKTKLNNTDRDALDIMDLKYDAKWDEIHRQFKTLVKKYHPDKNLGSKKYEDKLKKITLAYSQLKMTIGKK